MHQISFQENVDFISERNASRRQSDASFATTDLTIEVSSAASIRSLSSMGSTNSGTQFVKESSQPEFDFGRFDDCRRFQELVMGQGTHLVAPQFPIEGIVVARSGATMKESKTQCLYLWRRGSQQYIMYYANLASGTYQEFRMDCLRERPIKSKRSVQLEIQIPSSLLWSESGPRDPMMNTRRQSPTATANEPGLIRPIDIERLKSLSSLTIDFSKEEDKKLFLQHAIFG